MNKSKSTTIILIKGSASLLLEGIVCLFHWELFILNSCTHYLQYTAEYSPAPLKNLMTPCKLESSLKPQTCPPPPLCVLWAESTKLHTLPRCSVWKYYNNNLCLAVDSQHRHLLLLWFHLSNHNIFRTNWLCETDFRGATMCKTSWANPYLFIFCYVIGAAIYWNLWRHRWKYRM